MTTPLEQFVTSVEDFWIESGWTREELDAANEEEEPA